MTNHLPGEVFFIRIRIKKFMKEVFNRDSDKILDVGCGNKPFYKGIIKGKVFGFDIYPSNFTHFVGSVDNLPFKPKSFDKVLLANSLYYFSNPFKVINDIHSILKDNGTLFISVPFFYPIHDVPDDKFRFTEFGLRDMLKNKFNIRKIEAIGGFFTIPSVIIHSLLKGIPLIFPKSFKTTAKVVVFFLLYLPYLLSQIKTLVNMEGILPSHKIIVKL